MTNEVEAEMINVAPHPSFRGTVDFKAQWGKPGNENLLLHYNYARWRAKILRKVSRQSKPGAAGELLSWYKEIASYENRIATANLPLVFKIAKGFTGYSKQGITHDDLISRGNLALLKAIRKFDINSGNQFSTVATCAIRNALINLTKPAKETVRKGCLVKTFSIDGFKIQERGDEPSTQDTLVSIAVLKQNRFRGTGLAEVLREVIDKNLAQLTPMERLVLEMNYPMDGSPTLSWKEMAARVPRFQKYLRSSFRKLEYFLRKSEGNSDRMLSSGKC